MDDGSILQFIKQRNQNGPAMITANKHSHSPDSASYYYYYLIITGMLTHKIK